MKGTTPVLLMIVVVAVVLGSARLAVALVRLAADSDSHRLVINGVERTYYLHVPAALPPGAPLVVVLHGDASDGKSAFRDFGWEDQADLGQFVVAGPDGSRGYPDATPNRRNRRGWNSGVPGEPGSIPMSDDVNFIVAVIDDVARTNDIDRRRVYVAGFSSGGHMANRLGQEIAERLAAISTSASRMALLSHPPSRGMPVLISGGDRDPRTPTDGQLTLVDDWRKLNACDTAHATAAPTNVQIEVSGPCRDGSEVRYIFMQGVAHAWPTKDPIDLTQASWDFFKRFRLPAAPEGN